MIPPKIILLIPALETSHTGELAAVRDAIGRLLRAASLDWHDLARACAGSSPPAEPVRPTSAPSFADVARAARDLDDGKLTPRERAFVLDMCGKGFSFRPSPRQADWLEAIVAKLQSRRAA